MTKPLEAVTVVIPVHDAADALGKILPGWRVVLERTGRAFEVLVVDDGSTEAAAVERVVPRDPHFRLLRHDTRKGYGACLRTALPEAKHQLFFYTAVDYPYTPKDITKLLDRINLKDELLGKQPDLISGCRTGIPKPAFPHWVGRAWAFLARVFAGMPIPESSPWHGWPAFWYRTRARWVYGVPLADVNSCFKLFRTDFLRRFPIQSDGDFVHTELVAKATFLTSIMDEVPLTPKPDPVPPTGDIRADRRKLSPTRAKFSHDEESRTPVADAPGSPVVTLVPGAPALPVANPPGSPPPSPSPAPLP
jgi:glycosyltransferase involved in cell wall biosynthesis